MNKAAEDFQEVAVDNPSEEKYREKIGIGLKRIDPTELRLYSEDEDMVRMYYEELMDIVHLENSGGRLNQWRYGFSPEELKQLQNASKFD